MLLRGAATCAFAVAATGTALAADAPLKPAEEVIAPIKVELIGTSRLGCGEGVLMWTATSGGSQCAFDSATRGARITARRELGSSSIEAYATVAHSTTGAFTPERLLESPEQRSNEATDFFLVGIKASTFDNRLKLTGEFARTDRSIDTLVGHDRTPAGQTSRSGTSALVRLDAILADSPGLKWSMAGEYRAISDDYAVGRAYDLFRYSALPGSRLTLSTKARIGLIGLTAGLEESRTPYSNSSLRKAGADLHGISLRIVSRASDAKPIEGSGLLDSKTRSNAAYLDLDVNTLATSLLQVADELPFVVPSTISLNYRSGETESRYPTSIERYARTSLGVDGGWETPLGETSLSYWRDGRTGLTAEARLGAIETLQASHFVRRGNWRFGLDASLSRTRFDGENAFSDRALSFGQSIAYSAPGGPEFRLQLGQDRGHMRFRDDSYASVDHYSRITASLDLSRYLQKRFERPDLRLTLDYRKLVDRSDSEWTLEDEIERWVDDYRREGFLMSFGMKL